MGSKLRIGLLGGGRIGKLHGTNVQNFIPNAEVVVLADPFLNEDMEAWAQKIPLMFSQLTMWTPYSSALPQTHMLIS